MIRILVGAMIFATGLTTIAFAQATAPASVKDKMLVDAQGMTLYTFDKDSSGVSACKGPCAANWPALKADGVQGSPSPDWTSIARADGSKQWAYKGKPLYTFVKDKKPGDTVGDGFLNNSWHVARP